MTSALRAGMLTILVMLASCRPNPENVFHPGDVDSALRQAVAQGPGAVASLDSVGPQSWTFLYVFGPYTSQDAMRRCLATSEFEPYGLDRRDDAYALYFKSRSGQIWSMTMPRSRATFAADAVGREYPRASARFVVRRASSGARSELAPGAAPGRSCS
jgi:hypothetical protein